MDLNRTATEQGQDFMAVVNSIEEAVCSLHVTLGRAESLANALVGEVESKRGNVIGTTESVPVLSRLAYARDELRSLIAGVDAHISRIGLSK